MSVIMALTKLNISRNTKCFCGSTGNYELRSLTKVDLEEALDVLGGSFFINESVCKGCEINLPENKQAREELRKLCKITAEDGVSLFVRHMESGRIVAVSFNKLQFAPPPGKESFFVKFYNEEAKSSQAKSLMNYMITMDAKYDICAENNLDCVCELMFLGTLPDFGRQGLGRALVEATIQLTRELGQGLRLEIVAPDLRNKRPAAVTVLWTSSYSQKIGKALGFDVLKKVPFSEYVFNGKRFDERIEPIHEFGELAWFKL